MVLGLKRKDKGAKNGNAQGTVQVEMKGADAGPAEDEVDFAKISVEEALSLIGVTDKGLTASEAAARLAQYGPNKLPESHRSPILVFLGYMWNPLSWAMEVACILAIILLDYPDFALIIFLLLMNATISFVEEANADKAIKALASALAPKAKVIRDGEITTVSADMLVPGDVVQVRLGDVIAADIKLLREELSPGEEEAPLQVDQAALTGESLPVKKFSGNVCFGGSSIKQGERRALVYATGANTFFGRAAALISGTHNVANIAKIMARIGATCLVTIGVWVVIELAVGFGHFDHTCYLGGGLCPTLENILVIIVGGIPIAMPTVLSVTLALGAASLAKEGAIVARMSAVEEMAGMDQLCSDKTGTLTLNKLSIEVATVYPMAGLTTEQLLEAAALSADVVTEEAIDLVLQQTYPDKEALWKGRKQVKFVPFNPVDKVTIAVITDEALGSGYRLMKGAPQVVLKRSNNYEEIKVEVEAKIVEFANRGFRALGIARSNGDASGYVMLGLVPLFDPPRHDTAETIKRCKEQGIGVKMITGDQLLIGIETARQLGMGLNMHKTDVLTSAQKTTTEQLGELVENADGFAEVFPEHKFEIVKILQDRHHVVGMTGDGVNDAPALKKADVGVAVAGATDAARGAADIVLTEAGLSTIVTAVIGARMIFQRMTTYARYTVAMTFRICFTFGLLTVIYDWYFPTILIVMLAVFNDGAMIALSKDKVVPSRNPNHWQLVNIFIMGIVYGLYLTLSSWVLYYTATKTSFFADSLNMFSLEDTDSELSSFCNTYIPSLGFGNVNAPAALAYPQYADQLSGVSLLEQCQAEQLYVRGAMMRTLLYNQVSISGQAVVFVVRNLDWSLGSRAGPLTYVGFLAAQVGSTLVAALGFGGYPTPAPSQTLSNCVFCALSDGSPVPFFGGEVPVAGTVGVLTASVIGCTSYVIVAWIWSLMWYVLLDPIKWVLAFALNEDGLRDRVGFRKLARRNMKEDKPEEKDVQVQGMAAANYTNPLGRVSLAANVADVDTLVKRASIVGVRRAGSVSGNAELEFPRMERTSVTSPVARASLLQRVSFKEAPAAGQLTRLSFKEPVQRVSVQPPASPPPYEPVVKDSAV